ncbi:hypothetical protein [Quadrisphaera sp. DSM 44207]|uniref:hypothetical protein n=1 Tax=Quadrisphaera sp. DSM 44207 TaxID=1881057 RepID=UPI0015A38955|nr:hypothetical protein [Quadrisphaera sp. DSM 44207]
MFETEPSGQHAVLRARGLALEAARLVLGSSGLSLTTKQVRSATRALHEARQALEAAHLHLVRLALDAEPPGPRPGAATRAFLTRELASARGAPAPTWTPPGPPTPTAATSRRSGRPWRAGRSRASTWTSRCAP